MRILDKNLQEMLLGSGFSLLIKAISAAIVFLMNIAVTRALGPLEAGLFFLSLSLVTIVTAVGQVGLNNTLIRFVASNLEKGNLPQLHAVYRKAILWSGVFSFILSILILVTNDFLVNTLFNQAGLHPVVWAAAFAIPFVALNSLHANALQGLKKVIKATTTLNAIVPAALLAAVITFKLDTAIEVAWAYVGASVLALFCGRLWWVQSVPSTPEKINCSSNILLKSCIPLWGVTIMNQFITWSSQLVLGATGSLEEVALFSAAQRTAMLISFFLIAINAIAAPKFASLYSQGDMVGLRKVAVWSGRLMVLVALPTLTFMLFFSDFLMSLFGNEFRSAASALMILALGQFFNVLTGSVGYLLSMTGHERELRFNVSIAAVLGLCLGILLIPTHGVLGGAIATSIAVSSQNIIGVFQVKRVLGFNTLALLSKI